MSNTQLQSLSRGQTGTPTATKHHNGFMLLIPLRHSFISNVTSCPAEFPTAIYILSHTYPIPWELQSRGKSYIAAILSSLRFKKKHFFQGKLMRWYISKTISCSYQQKQNSSYLLQKKANLITAVLKQNHNNRRPKLFI